MRVCSGVSSLFVPLREAIRDVFWPALFSSSVDEKEADLLSLPTRIGGLRVRYPVQISIRSFEASRSGVDELEIVNYMRGGQFSVCDHLETCMCSCKGKQPQTPE